LERARGAKKGLTCARMGFTRDLGRAARRVISFLRGKRGQKKSEPGGQTRGHGGGPWGKPSGEKAMVGQSIGGGVKEKRLLPGEEAFIGATHSWRIGEKVPEKKKKFI